MADQTFDISSWRSDILTRLEILRVKARQNRQFMDAHNLDKLYDDKLDFQDAWQQIKDLFPDDLTPKRASALDRHLFFAHRIDFEDIEKIDIPDVAKSVMRYRRSRDEYISEEIDRLKLRSPISDMMHTQVREACVNKITERQFQEASRAAVTLLMHELRRLSGSELDGEKLIQKVVGTQPGSLSFSDCVSNESKRVTDGLKLIALGLYKGVRNPLSHAGYDFGPVDAFQIMSVVSFLLTHLQLVEREPES